MMTELEKQSLLFERRVVDGSRFISVGLLKITLLLRPGRCQIPFLFLIFSVFEAGS